VEPAMRASDVAGSIPSHAARARNDMDTIRRLAADAAAFAEAWERMPLVSTGLDDFSDVFSVAIAERLIHSGMPLTAIRLYRDGTRLPVEGVAAERQGGLAEARADGASLLAHIGSGATVVLEYLQVYCPEVARFAADFAGDVGHSTYCAAFITPAGSRGIVPHYDTSSVFLRQIFGSKRWRVSAPVERWPTQEWRSTMSVDTERLVEVMLEKDDCLYIPRGFIHAGDAVEEGSIHLTVAITPTTWADTLRRAVTAAAASEELREAVPARFLQADEAMLFRQKLAGLQMPVWRSPPPGAAATTRDDLIGALHRASQS
ncbi:MAG: JmjC domain-containing protein, partial [Steroidobacteraceae bacterium]